MRGKRTPLDVVAARRVLSREEIVDARLEAWSAVRGRYPDITHGSFGHFFGMTEGAVTKMLIDARENEDDRGWA